MRFPVEQIVSEVFNQVVSDSPTAVIPPAMHLLVGNGNDHIPTKIAKCRVSNQGYGDSHKTAVLPGT